MSLDSLDTLFHEELTDLYSAEKQLIQALPKVAKASSSPQLKRAFEDHLQQTKGHLERLEQVFESIGKKPGRKKCRAMEGLIEEGSELIKEEKREADEAVFDAALIASAQRIEHYEMAGYGCVRTYARILGNKQAEKLLQQTLNEEAAADEKLTKIAESSINLEAASV